MVDVTHEVPFPEQNAENRQKPASRSIKITRQKRGIDVINDDGNKKHENVDTLKLFNSKHTISEDVSADNYEIFPEKDRDRYRLRAKLTIMKDDVQNVLPIAKVRFSAYKVKFLFKNILTQLIISLMQLSFL